MLELTAEESHPRQCMIDRLPLAGEARLLVSELVHGLSRVNPFYDPAAMLLQQQCRSGTSMTQSHRFTRKRHFGCCMRSTGASLRCPHRRQSCDERCTTEMVDDGVITMQKLKTVRPLLAFCMPLLP